MILLPPRPHSSCHSNKHKPQPSSFYSGKEIPELLVSIMFRGAIVTRQSSQKHTTASWIGSDQSSLPPSACQQIQSNDLPHFFKNGLVRHRVGEAKMKCFVFWGFFGGNKQVEHLEWEEAFRLIEQADKEAPPLSLKRKNHLCRSFSDTNVGLPMKAIIWAAYLLKPSCGFSFSDTDV